MNLKLMVFIQEVIYLIYVTDGTYKINHDEHRLTGTHWTSFYVNADNVTYFDSFGVHHTPKEIPKFIGNKNIRINIGRIQGYDLVICG